LQKKLSRRTSSAEELFYRKQTVANGGGAGTVKDLPSSTGRGEWEKRVKMRRGGRRASKRGVSKQPNRQGYLSNAVAIERSMRRFSPEGV